MSNKKIIVIGGGLTGFGVSLLLAKTFPSWDIIISYPNNPNQTDSRSLVVTPAGQQFFEKCGVWQNCVANATSINSVVLAFETQQQKINMPNGQKSVVVPAQQLLQSCQEQITSCKNITVRLEPVIKIDNKNTIAYWHNEAIEADMICVCAGGSFLDGLTITTEQKDFHSNAWGFSCDSISALSGDDALLAFTQDGHLAILPKMLEKRNGVITCPNNYTKYQITEHINKRLNQCGFFANNLQVGFSYKLVAKSVAKRVQNNTVLLGNAAHQLHPIGAQGFNLTIKTINKLVQSLQSNQDINTALNNFLQTSQSDINQMLKFTNLLASHIGKPRWRLSTIIGFGFIKHLSKVLPAIMLKVMGDGYVNKN